MKTYKVTGAPKRSSEPEPKIALEITFTVDGTSTTLPRTKFLELMARLNPSDRVIEVVNGKEYVLVLCFWKDHPGRGRAEVPPESCYIKRGERRALEQHELCDDI